MHYLDHNATSPLRPRARDAMERALAISGNASSVHGRGRAARAMIEDARERLAAFMSVEPTQLTFTSGGTEANALALWGAVQGCEDSSAPVTRLLVSAIEHDSVLANAKSIVERVPGITLHIVPVTADGVVDLDALRDLLRAGEGRALIAVMAANNETGVMQPIAEISALAKEANALLLVDAVQAAGKIPLTFEADYITLSAHKLGGPQGAGALIAKAEAPLAAQMLGGGQERRRRAGTENVAAIAGFGAVARLSEMTNITALRERFENQLFDIAPDAIVFSAAATRLPNTSNFAIPGVSAETALMALDLDGVMVSSGSACSSGTVKPSHLLSAMGVPDDLARCALRISFGWDSVPADADAAIASLSKLIMRVRARKAA